MMRKYENPGSCAACNVSENDDPAAFQQKAPQSWAMGVCVCLPSRLDLNDLAQTCINTRNAMLDFQLCNKQR